MRPARFAFAAVTLCAITAAAGQATQPGQQGQPRRPATQPNQTQPDQTQPRERMREGMPGRMMNQPQNLSPERQALSQLAGFWNIRAEIFGAEGGQPQTEEARAMRRWVLNGAFLQELHTGMEDVGMGGDRQRGAQSRIPGIGYFGYDENARAYNAAWLDAGTGAIHSTRGRYDEASRTFTYTAIDTDPSGPAQGGPVTVKLTIVNEDEHTVEMFQGEAAQGDPVYRITYARAEGGPGMGRPGMNEPGMDEQPGRRPATPPGQQRRPATPPGQTQPGGAPGTQPPR